MPLIAENIPAAQPPSRTGAARRAAVVILDGGVSGGYLVFALSLFTSIKFRATLPLCLVVVAKRTTSLTGSRFS